IRRGPGRGAPNCARPASELRPRTVSTRLTAHVPSITRAVIDPLPEPRHGCGAGTSGQEHGSFPAAFPGSRRETGMGVHETAVERYLAAWNATDPSGIATAVAAAWTDGGGYTDPLASVTGHQEIFGLIGAVQAQFPGHRFRLAGAVDGHHDVVRFGWELVAA